MAFSVRPKVFVSRIFPEIAVNLLKEAGLYVEAWNKDRPMTQEELIQKALSFDGLLCTVTDKIDKYFLRKCSHLKIISQYAVGYDNIDVAEATRLGILIGNTPDAVTEATADLAFGLMIATARKMFYMHKTISKGEWGYFKPEANLGVELKNKTLGVFGLGRIGFEMAKKCIGAYDMNIIYNNRKQNPRAEKELNAKYVDFNTLLKESDVLTVHCTLNDSTTEIFNKNAFDQMKSSAIFVNTSRGMVHDEQALINALETGNIWGTGLDVTNPEPMLADNPLLSMENVAILPHIGSATNTARNEMARLAAENIIGYFKNKKVHNLVNLEVLKEVRIL